MTTIYTTKEGDMVDWIAWEHYGTPSAVPVRAILEANPGLADYGPELPAGVEIILPEVAQQATKEGVRLWD